MMKYADIIIPNGADNGVAIDIICQNLKLKLKKLGLIRVKSALSLENSKENDMIDFDVVEQHINIADHCKQMKTPDISYHSELKSMLSKLIYDQDKVLRATYMSSQVQKLYDLVGDIKDIPVYYGNLCKDQQYTDIRERIEQGHTTVLFYPSMIQTDTYSKLIQLIMKTTAQKGLLKVCTLFADENCSRDLGRYDMIEIITLYFSNYLKMFQLPFDEVLLNEFQQLFEKLVLAKAPK
jgi:hypothetical protein